MQQYYAGKKSARKVHGQLIWDEYGIVIHPMPRESKVAGVCVCMYIYICTCIQKPGQAYIYIYIYIYIHIHVHIYIYIMD